MKLPQEMPRPHCTLYGHSATRVRQAARSSGQPCRDCLWATESSRSGVHDPIVSREECCPRSGRKRSALASSPSLRLSPREISGSSILPRPWNLLSSATAFFAALGKHAPATAAKISPHSAPRPYQVLDILQLDSTGNLPTVALIELVIKLLSHQAEFIPTLGDLSGPHCELHQLCAIFDLLHTKRNVSDIVTILYSRGNSPKRATHYPRIRALLLSNTL